MSERDGRGGQQAEAIAQEARRRPRSRDLRPVLALVPFVRRYPGILAFALLALLVSSTATLVLPAAVREMVDHGFSKESAEFIDRYFLVLIGVGATLAASTAVRYFFMTWLGERVVADVRRKVYSHVLSLSPAFFEITRTGEVLSRLTADTTLIQTAVGSSVSMALRNGVIFAGGIALMVVTSPRMSAIALAAVLLIVIPMILFGRSVRRLSRRSQDRIGDTSAYAGETINAIQTVQAYTHEEIDRARYGSAVERAFETAVKRMRARAFMTALVIFLVFSGIIGGLWAGAHSVISGATSVGVLTQFVFYCVLVAGSVGVLAEVWGDLQAAAGASERLMELLRIVPQIRAPENPAVLPAPGGEVELREVTFRYPTRPETAALDRFSLRVKPGETVALVGPSGAGKTTVFQLILRFYDPQQGEILIDGVNLKRADPKQARARIAAVPQESTIFAASVTENIRFGRPEASEAEVMEAARQAQADEFVQRLPQGYATELGERGVTLSGGQRQRIAIARAMLRNAPILLLDEATSALDAESERLVQQGLRTLMAGRTTLVIAHRLATVQRADRIVVMDRGRIAAEGTHEALIAKGGLYARLASLQFQTKTRAQEERAASP